MKRPIILLSMGILLQIQPALAQFNIKTDDGTDVSIGPYGISVQEKNQKVNITPGGIQVRKPGEAVDISPAGINVNKPGRTAKIKTHKSGSSSSSSVRASGSSTNSVTVTGSSGLSLEQQISNLEIQVYGHRTEGGTLLARVEKLERDNLGQKSNGTIRDRVNVLARELTASGGSSAISVQNTGRSRQQQSQQYSQQYNRGYNNQSAGSIQITGNNQGAPAGSVQIRDTDGGGGIIQFSGTGTGQNSSVGINMNSNGNSQEIVMNSSNYQGTVTCSNNDLVLNASNCKIKVAGPVRGLILNGSDNEISCDSVQHVQANGSLNKVNWSPSARPSIQDVGSQNSLRSR